MQPSAALSRGNACLACRRKKSRCDGVKPICAPCERSGRQCQYTEPPRSRIQLLQDKIQELNNKVRLLEQKDTNSSQGSHSTPSPPQSIKTLEQSHPLSPGPRGTVPGAGGMVWIAHPESPTPPFTGEVTPQAKEKLIQTFLANRDKCCFEMSIDRFRQGLALPPNDPRAPHPALLNAILLMGCYFERSPCLNRYEAQFLQIAIDELTQILNNPEQLPGYVFHDFVRASNLVAFYLCYKGCYTDACHIASQAANIAMTAELHQIPSSVWRSPPMDDGEQFLPHPRDSTELGERIYTWWQTFILDKMLSIICNFPASLSNGLDSDPRKRITTPWPRLMSDYEMGHVSAVENTSVGHLYSNYTPSTYARPETLSSLRAQGMSLIAQATQLCRNFPLNMAELRVVDASIQRFIATLPDLRAGGESGEMAGQPGISPMNPRLVFIHTLAHAALLILHQRGSDQLSRHRCVTATQGIASIITELRDYDYLEMFVGLGHVWYMCGEVLVKIYRSSQGSTRDTARRDLQSVMQAMKRLSFSHIVLGLRLRGLEESI